MCIFLSFCLPWLQVVTTHRTSWMPAQHLHHPTSHLHHQHQHSSIHDSSAGSLANSKMMPHYRCMDPASAATTPTGSSMAATTSLTPGTPPSHHQHSQPVEPLASPGTGVPPSPNIPVWNTSEWLFGGWFEGTWMMMRTIALYCTVEHVGHIDIRVVSSI